MKSIGRTLVGQHLVECSSEEFRMLRIIASLMRGESVDNTRVEILDEFDFIDTLKSIENWILLKYDINRLQHTLDDLNHLVVSSHNVK